MVTGRRRPAPEPFSHLDDLLAVLDHAGAGPVWLAGASAGGGLALDAALVAPHRVAGLVLMGTAVSGAPEPELDAATRRFEPLLDKAYAARDAGEINRLETWLWLDGPGQPEGRVGGAARKLALDMNAIIIGNGVPETAGAAGVDAWHRLAEIKVPVTVACGDLDVPFLVDRCRLLADRLPAARHHVLARHGTPALPGISQHGSAADPLRGDRGLARPATRTPPRRALTTRSQIANRQGADNGT